MLLSIAEIPQTPFHANVHFDGGEWDVAFQDPFTAEEENNLRWCFEKHLEMPMLEGARAQQASASVASYGQSLFKQLTADPDLYAALKRHHSDQIRIEVTGSPEFHSLHWESLWDPKDPEPFCHRSAVVRRVPTKGGTKIDLAPAPVIRVLVVVARPGEGRDVGYRTISRPLVETLRQAQLAVQLDFVRPGSWLALQQHLAAHPKGYYHVLHFDGHGVVSNPAEIEKARQQGKLLYNSESGQQQQRRAYLFFEAPQQPSAGTKPPESGEAIEASTFAALVNNAQIPIVILNACQSARQEKDSAESNLASHLAAAGVRAVLAMAYSVTVSAAQRFMQAFYQEAFRGSHLSHAVTKGRQELKHYKQRRAYFGMSVELEDWLLPVLYESDANIVFQIRATSAEERANLEREAAQFEPETPPALGFWGRDLDILRIERRLLSQEGNNILLLEGMGGTGKSTLLQHLAWWWHRTGLIERVFLFEYDQKPWNRQQILFEIARRLGMPLHPDERIAQEAVAKRLRAERCLLILDNLESVTGEQLAVGQILAEPERKALQEFLRKLQGGKTLVLAGSRGKEEWLARGTFESNIHPLRGLDPEARSAFGEAILRKAGVTDVAAVRETTAYRDLLALLDGHPLAMQVVLNNLKERGPEQVLAALREGDVKLDGDGESKTESILRCIDYSHSNLTPAARQLLACFAPFTGVVFLPMVDEYVALLQAQPELAALPWQTMPQVLQEAERWGLVRSEGSLLYLQPVFPFFLRSRVEAGVRAAVDRAFHQHYDGYCGAIRQMQGSKDPQQRQSGQRLARLELDNVRQSLTLGLLFQLSIWNSFTVMSNHFDSTRDQKSGLALAERIINLMSSYPGSVLNGSLGLEFAMVLDDAANRFQLLRQYEKAKSFYFQALAIHEMNTAQESSLKVLRAAGLHHQIGTVSQNLRQWAEAESHYREALRLKAELQNRYSQSSTYHQLGVLAQVQRQWEEAERHYREALSIDIEFQDRYGQASCYHQLGMVAQERGRLEDAASHYRDALEMYRELREPYESATTHLALGFLASARRQSSDAERHLRKALSIFVEFGDSLGQASTHHGLGVLAESRVNWLEAESHYREALRIYVEFEDRYSQASTYHQLGRVAEEQRQWQQAESHYLDALRIFAEFDDNHSLAVVLGSLARLSVEDLALISKVAEILGVTPEEAAQLLQQIHEA